MRAMIIILVLGVISGVTGMIAGYQLRKASRRLRNIERWGRLDWLHRMN